MQEKAANVGFDWKDNEGVLDKIEEEIRELRVAMQSQDKAGMEEEFGDVFFSLVNLARHLDIVGEKSLQRTNVKFQQRLQYIEREAERQGKTLSSMELNEMDVLWNEAKKHGV
jgi:uncharacterized protein YabN with tetrapyrrole methylase and pyrophosphatase domain